MRLAIDIDGVVSNTVPLMVEVIEKRGYKIVFDRYNPHIEGIEDREAFMYEVVDEVYSTRMDQLKPYEGVVESIRKISRDLGQITFVTARRAKFSGSTVIWLQRNFNISFGFVIRSSSEKPQFILNEGFDVFIEDRLSTVNRAADLGIKTYLIDRPWNSGRYTHSDVIRVNSLEEVYLMERSIK